MATMSGRLSRAIPFNSLKPFDSHNSLISQRRPAARRLISPLFTASITRSRKSCEYGFAISCWPPPSQQVNQNLADSGIPLRFQPSARRSSRGSIREAIWELIDQGLLINRPYAGAFVVSVDEKTMTEVFSLRGALERYCFTQLWPKRNETFRKEFTTRHKALVKTIRARKHFDAIEAEMHFHSYPYEFSGNAVLLDVWRQLSKKIQLSFAMSQVIVRSVEFIGTSESYIAAALDDDLDAMHREINRHLELGVIAVRKLLRYNSVRAGD